MLQRPIDTRGRNDNAKQRRGRQGRPARRHLGTLIAATAVVAALGACGEQAPGGDGGDGDNGSDSADVLDADKSEAKIPFVCDDSQRLVAGSNVFYAAGQRREVMIDFPNVEPDTRVAVVFAWHGVGDTAANFRAFFTFSGVTPNTDPDFPFILVVPQGLRLSPLQNSPAQGMEWDILVADSSSDNLEAQLFEGVLGCLAVDYNVDPARIYNVGFSGGAIVSTMLHSLYPQHVPAILTMSGAWFNDPNQANSINTGGFVNINLSWEDLDAADTGLVFQTHGGPNDGYAPLANLEIINFDYCAEQSKTFLPTHSRTIIDCPHRAGHAPHPGLSPQVVFEIIKLHIAGEPSPLESEGLPAGLPADCRLNP